MGQQRPEPESPSRTQDVAVEESGCSSLYASAEFVARENPAAAQALVQRIHTVVYHLEPNTIHGRAIRIHSTRELIVANTLDQPA